MIARNAEVPIANSRLNPTAEDSITAAESAAEGGRFSVVEPGRGAGGASAAAR